VILTRWRRRLYAILWFVWVVAIVGAAATGRFDLLWLPVIGLVTSSIVLLRDRAGRRRLG
jgi:hypothetical protein